MRFRLIVVLSVLPSAAGAWDDLERMRFTTALGTVLAGEEACQLAYEQPAIRQLIQESVPPSDMEFAPQLQMMTRGAQHELDGLSTSSLTAHCMALEQSARHYGFIE